MTLVFEPGDLEVRQIAPNPSDVTLPPVELAAPVEPRLATVVDLTEYRAAREEKAEAARVAEQDRRALAKFRALQDPTGGLLSVVDALVSWTSSLLLRERGGKTLSELNAEKDDDGKKGGELSKHDRDFLLWTDKLDDAIRAAREAANLAALIPAEAVRHNVLEGMSGRTAVAA